MKWTKRGLIFKTDHNFPWMVTHASIPVVDKAEDGRLRIYFAARDEHGRSRPTYIEVDEQDPSHVLYVHDNPILPLGEQGTFDDNGIMPCWIVNNNGVKYMYYIGWNPQVTVSYRLAIGLAKSYDAGATFDKHSIGPICDRDILEPFFNTAPCVLKEADKWRMWYVSCTGWEVVQGWPEPKYLVKYAESQDGIHWMRTNHVCIGYDEFTQAIGRPCVYIKEGKYRMLYSYRSTTSYRSDPNSSYRLGYAESGDGLNWIRLDNEIGIERSSEGWDSDMIEYCYRYDQGDTTYLFYNGNGFGRSGIGYAVLDTRS
jgi:hypothetical protein